MKERVYLFDNLKAILIFLVVFAHFLSGVKNNFDIVYSLHTFIYAFHMPCFLFVSGYFSKQVAIDGKYKRTKIINYALIYLIVQIFLCIFTKSPIEIFIPKLAMWYLLVMIMAHLCIPYISMLKPKFVFITSIVLGLLACTDTIKFLSISRFLVFMPFFLLGYYLELDKIKKLFKKKYVVLSVISLIALLGFIHFSGLKRGLIQLFYGVISYKDLTLDNMFVGIAVRMMYYLMAFYLIFAVLVLIPKGKNKFTKIGERTLQIYILHIPFVYVFLGTDNLITNGYNFDNCVNSPVELIVLLVLIFLFTLFLSLKFFSKPFDMIMKKDFMLKEKN